MGLNSGVKITEKIADSANSLSFFIQCFNFHKMSQKPAKRLRGSYINKCMLEQLEIIEKVLSKEYRENVL